LASNSYRNRSKEETRKLKTFSDCGCETKEEVEKLGVHVGCVITYPDQFMILNENKFVCRAIDNRLGGFMIAEVARLLHENGKKLPFRIIHYQFSSGRGWSSWCRDDYKNYQT
jgi:putative aminopeptidase FrvX